VFLAWFGYIGSMWAIGSVAGPLVVSSLDILKLFQTTTNYLFCRVELLRRSNNSSYSEALQNTNTSTELAGHGYSGSTSPSLA